MIIRVLISFLLIGLSLPSLASGQQVVVVVLDDSGSMDQRMRSGGPKRITAAKSALLKVLEQLPGDAEIGIVALNGPDGSGDWIKPLGPVDRSNLNNTISKITAGGATPLGEFIKVGTDALLTGRKPPALRLPGPPLDQTLVDFPLSPGPRPRKNVAARSPHAAGLG